MADNNRLTDLLARLRFNNVPVELEAAAAIDDLLAALEPISGMPPDPMTFPDGFIMAVSITAGQLRRAYYAARGE